MPPSITSAAFALALATSLVGGLTDVAAAAPTRPATVPATATRPRTAKHASTSPRKQLATCLEQHGVPKARLTAALGAGTGKLPVVPATRLESAGRACQHLVPKPEAEVLQKLDTCIGQHHVKTAHSGSSLADLLLLDPDAPAVRSARSTCLPIAEGETTKAQGKAGAPG